MNVTGNGSGQASMAPENGMGRGIHAPDEPG